MKEYPLLLSATHVAEICSCHRSTAYEIMRDHIGQYGGMEAR